ncbi:hypothetical protein acdb102_25180 [Acidothermaceae bacterium B102]|nr:hypothetical protein acdb102_25180 [Acidothermaceae bacterium B102]
MAGLHRAAGGGRTVSRRVVVIGNLTVDDVVRPDGSTAMAQPGGNAIYAALGARLWSDRVCLVTRRGPGLPADIVPSLVRLGVDTAGVVETTSPTSRAWLVYEEDGSRRFLDRSVPDEATRWVVPADIPLAWLTDGSPVVHIAPMPLEVARTLVDFITEVSPDATVVVDPHESWPGDEPALAGLASGVDVFAPSRDELATLMGSSDVEAGAEGLRSLGFGSVVVKLGAEGALVVDASGPVQVPASLAQVVDVTGAGDTFCGALAGALATGLSLHDAVLRGVSTAAWSIEKSGSFALASMDTDDAAARLAGTTTSPSRTVAVLGSARLGSDDPRWHEARALGAALGAAGWTVMTGGYGGLMAATAQGAHEAGAVVVGLPMSAWANLEPSEYVSELRWSADYAERLGHILGADVVIGLPGGIGTLAEATVVWSALQTEPGAARLVLFGAAWQRLVAAFGAELVVGTEDLLLARVALDVEAAVAMTEEAYRDTSATAGPRG